MAEEQIKALFHRLGRRGRQPEVQDHYLDPPVVEPFTGESVAAELRRARQDLGRDLVRASGDLKIRRVYLQAIEDGRFDDLPGATYAVGFIRAYAEYLGLNSIEIVGRFKDEVQGGDERLHLVFPTPVPESKIPSGAVLLISVLLIALAYGGWYYLSSRDDDMDGQVLDLPDSLEPLVSSGADQPLPDELDSTRNILLSPAKPMVADEGQPDAQAPQEPEEGESEPSAQAPQEPQEPLKDEAEPRVEAPQEPDAPASLGSAVSAEFEAEPAAGASLVGVFSEAPSTTPEASTAPFVAAATSGIPAAPAPDTLLPDDDSRQPRVYGVENETARIVLRARLDSWVQVFAADESLILTRVLQPGDSYRVPSLAGLTLVTGNAGGLEVQVDGATVPPLGPVGAIRRGIALDAERLLAGTALAQ